MRGGKRVGSGRPKMDDETKEIKLAERRERLSEIAAKEMVFPALCMAFRAEPGKFKDRYLSVELSKVDIKRAYGKDGLDIWLRYFRQEKLGHRDKDGNAHPTRWVLHLGSYDIAKLLVESLGYTIKDLPNPGFPPLAMQKKLDALDAKKMNRLVSKAGIKEVTDVRKKMKNLGESYEC